MYESKRDPSRKFGSAFVGKRFDSYADGAQPHEESTSMEHGGDKANLEGADKVEASPTATSDSVSTPHETVASHGPAVHVEYTHNGDEHKVNMTHEDGHKHESVHSTAAEAYEAGGDKAWTDVKRESHPDQQGARSEEENYEQTETA